MKNLYFNRGCIVEFNDQEFDELETVDIKYNGEFIEGKRFCVSMLGCECPVQMVVPVDNFTEI